ncbi:hypothetical protein BDF14DRAFT_1884425 [Spinellus fusiger]|nr:hypothetical protein BDF14DRAFT_1884425 [Spinellus fusiger]
MPFLPSFNKRSSRTNIELAPNIEKAEIISYEHCSDNKLWYTIHVVPHHQNPLPSESDYKQEDRLPTYKILRRYQDFKQLAHTLSQELNIERTMIASILSKRFLSSTADKSKPISLPKLKRQIQWFHNKAYEKQKDELNAFMESLLSLPSSIKCSFPVRAFFGTTKVDLETANEKESPVRHTFQHNHTTSRIAFVRRKIVYSPHPRSRSQMNIRDSWCPCLFLPYFTTTAHEEEDRCKRHTTGTHDHPYNNSHSYCGHFRSHYNTHHATTAHHSYSEGMPNPTTPVATPPKKRHSVSHWYTFSTLPLRRKSPPHLSSFYIRATHTMSTPPPPPPPPLCTPLAPLSPTNAPFSHSKRNSQANSTQDLSAVSHISTTTENSQLSRLSTTPSTAMDSIKLKVIHSPENIIVIQIPRHLTLTELRQRILRKLSGPDYFWDDWVLVYNHARSSATSCFDHTDKLTWIVTEEDWQVSMVNLWYKKDKVTLRCIHGVKS